MAPSPPASLTTPSILWHLTIRAWANVILGNTEWALSKATSESLIHPWMLTFFALETSSVGHEVLSFITSVLDATLRGLIWIIILWTFIASSILLLVFKLFITLVCNTLILLRSRIGIIFTSEALSSDCPNVSISSGHIALDAVPGISIWVEVVLTILTSTVSLQDLVFDALVRNTFGIVSIWLCERTASYAVTQVIVDLGQKIAGILLAISSSVIWSLSSWALFTSSIYLHNALLITWSIINAYLEIRTWISEISTRNTFTSFFADYHVLHELTRFLNAISFGFIRTIVVWANFTFTFFGNYRFRRASWLLANSTVDRLSVVRAFFTPCVFTILSSASLNLNLIFFAIN